MFKKTIKYENFNGEEVSKDFYFHLSKAELLEMGFSDMQARVTRIMEAKDNLAILKEFSTLIGMAVGIRSEDGETFVKDERAKNLLMRSPAYDELLMELVTDAEAGSAFIKNLLPEKMQKELGQELAKQVTLLPVAKHSDDQAPDPFAEPEDKRPLYMREHRHPTKSELMAMTKEELVEAHQYRSGSPDFAKNDD